MKFKFNGATKENKVRIKNIIGTVKTSSAKDLFVRISIHKPFKVLEDGNKLYKGYRYSGYYKNFFDHGLFESEYKEVYQKKDCPHVIQIHLHDNFSDFTIASIFAHEWRHYLQYTKLRNRFIGNTNKRKKRIELDARRWTEKRLKKLGILLSVEDPKRVESSTIERVKG